jgi:RNA polymerase sigma-70 factor (ECF subfamily)
VLAALARALAGMHRVREPAALAGWYVRVLTNLCIGVLRRRRVAAGFARLVAARGEPAVAAIDLGPDHRRVLAALDALPARQKAAMVLRYGHELPLDEIADVLDLGVESVKTHLKRARARLRARLGVSDAAR